VSDRDATDPETDSAPLRRVLVVGATGTQGGAVVDALLAADRPFDVHGLTRDPGSQAARTLAQRGVTLHEADPTDRAAVDRALAASEAAAVFLLTTGGADVERRQGETVVAAAAAADVAHLVFSSGGDADRGDHIPHVAAKHAVEELVRESGLRWTILRPHSFVSTLARNRDAVGEGRLPFPIPEGERFAFVDTRDIGRLTVRALAEPERFAGETIELAGEVCSLPELAAAVSDVVGHPVDPVHLPPDSLGPEMATFAAFMADASADPQALRDRYGFEPHDVRAALRALGWGEAA
jgi:uncharacterized protein YbjT (DUF2867 family)